jgi:hypothetical protein
MRLLQRSNTGDFGLTMDLEGDDKIPPYAILSHTWNDGQEVTFQDLIDGTGKSKAPRHIRVVLILSRSLLSGDLVSRHSASSRLYQLWFS